MRKIVFFISITIISLTAQDIFSQGKELNVQELLAKGTQALKEDKFPEAEVLLIQAIEISPQHCSLFYALSCVYSRWAEFLASDGQEKMKAKALDNLRNSIILGFRDLEKLLKDSDLDFLKDSDEFGQIVEDLEYLINKEKMLHNAKVLKYRILVSKEAQNTKIPFIVLLEPVSILKKEADLDDEIIKDGKIGLVLLSPDDDSEKNKKGWTEFYEYRIFKTLKQIQENEGESKNLDWTRFGLCGFEQSGFAALKTILKLKDEYKKAIFINTPLFSEFDELAELKGFSNKSDYKFLVFQSESHSLSFEESSKNWKMLQESGFENLKIFTDDFGLQQLKILIENKQTIIDFLAN